MALKGCQQTGQKLFQDIFLSSLILSGWNLMGPSICNHNDLHCWHISGGIFWSFTLNVYFDLHTNRGQLDENCRSGRKSKQCDTQCVISVAFLLRGEQWEPMRGGEVTKLQLYVGVPKRQAKLEPVLRWGHAWSLLYFTLQPSALFKGNFMNSKLWIR